MFNPLAYFDECGRPFIQMTLAYKCECMETNTVHIFGNRCSTYTGKITVLTILNWFIRTCWEDEMKQNAYGLTKYRACNSRVGELLWLCCLLASWRTEFMTIT